MGWTSLVSPGSSWSRVSPELMELVSSSRLDFTYWPAFLLCSILELPVAGSCRTTSVGTALEGLSCQSSPPLLTACWVHGQVDCLNHCNILMALSKSRVLFTDSNPRAFFRHSYSWGLNDEYSLAILSSWKIICGLYGVTSPCTSWRILIRMVLM